MICVKRARECRKWNTNKKQKPVCACARVCVYVCVKVTASALPTEPLANPSPPQIKLSRTASNNNTLILMITFIIIMPVCYCYECAIFYVLEIFFSSKLILPAMYCPNHAYLYFTFNASHLCLFLIYISLWGSSACCVSMIPCYYCYHSSLIPHTVRVLLPWAVYTQCAHRHAVYMCT